MSRLLKYEAPRWPWPAVPHTQRDSRATFGKEPPPTDARTAKILPVRSSGLACGDSLRLIDTIRQADRCVHRCPSLTEHRGGTAAGYDVAPNVPHPVVIVAPCNSHNLATQLPTQDHPIAAFTRILVGPLQALGGLVAGPGNQPGQRGEPRQQHIVLPQPAHRVMKHRRRTIPGVPRMRVQLRSQLSLI